VGATAAGPARGVTANPRLIVRILPTSKTHPPSGPIDFMVGTRQVKPARSAGKQGVFLPVHVGSVKTGQSPSAGTGTTEEGGPG